MKELANWIARGAAVFAFFLLRDASSAERTVVTTKTTTDAQGNKTVETVEKPADESAAERLLADGGETIVKIGMAAVAAFLAGAVVQRILLAEFAFKAAGVELPDIAKATSDSAEALASLSAAVEQVKATADQAAQDALEALMLALEDLETSSGDEGGAVS